MKIKGLFVTVLTASLLTFSLSAYSWPDSIFGASSRVNTSEHADSNSENADAINYRIWVSRAEVKIKNDIRQLYHDMKNLTDVVKIHSDQEEKTQ